MSEPLNSRHTFQSAAVNLQFLQIGKFLDRGEILRRNASQKPKGR